MMKRLEPLSWGQLKEEIGKLFSYWWSKILMRETKTDFQPVGTSFHSFTRGSTSFSSEPLEIVVKKGDVDLLRFFLSTDNLPNGLKIDLSYSFFSESYFYGDDSNKHSSIAFTVGQQALIMGCQNGHLEIVRLLCEKGVDLNKSVKWKGGSFRDPKSRELKETNESITLREEALQACRGNKEIEEFLKKGM